jgi:hypothetical protein
MDDPGVEPMSTEAALAADLLVIGGGSRALILLERLATAVTSGASRPLKVIVADPGPLGPGLHRTDQPPYITFNSPSTCPTIFVNERIPRLRSQIRGLSFAEWLTAYAGELSPEFQPRAVAGRYLSWSAQHLLNNLPPNLHVEHLRECVVEAAHPAAGVLTFRTDRSTTIRARGAVIAVGHSFAAAESDPLESAGALGERVISNPFPTHVQLRGLDRRHTIAIRGLGLTGLDILAELTVGRGGRYEAAEAGAPPRYVASGDEPRIYMYSRSSCPIRCRPVGVDGGSTPFDPVILTPDRKDQLLDGARPIEFRTAVFPLILAEMAHRLARGPVRGMAPGPLALIRDWFAAGGVRRGNGQIAEFFLRSDVNGPLLDLLRPVLGNGIHGTTEAAMAFLREDIEESRRGIAGSPLKHGLEALLEARDFVKDLVDFRHDVFSDPHWIFRTFPMLVNRNTIGPQLRKSEEFLSLLRSGIVQIVSPGSLVTVRDGSLLLSGPAFDGVEIDHLIRADHMRLASAAQANFVRSLIATGLALPVRDAENALIGLKIDQRLRLFSRNGADDPPIWGTGPICDGSSYYNNYVPCIQPDAEYPYFESDRIATDVVQCLQREGP